jgi:hypothetical protein
MPNRGGDHDTAPTVRRHERPGAPRATVRPVAHPSPDGGLASTIADTPLDRLTGLVDRTPFLRVVDGLTHARDGAFGVVLLRFDATQPCLEVGARVQGLLRPGDVAARWSSDELVVFRHPLDDVDDLEALADDLLGALRSLGADVEVRSSSDSCDSPSSLLSHARCASDTSAPGAASPRHATPAAG